MKTSRNSSTSSKPASSKKGAAITTSKVVKKTPAPTVKKPSVGNPNRSQSSPGRNDKMEGNPPAQTTQNTIISNTKKLPIPHLSQGSSSTIDQRIVDISQKRKSAYCEQQVSGNAQSDVLGKIDYYIRDNQGGITGLFAGGTATSLLLYFFPETGFLETLGFGLATGGMGVFVGGVYDTESRKIQIERRLETVPLVQKTKLQNEYERLNLKQQDYMSKGTAMMSAAIFAWVADVVLDEVIGKLGKNAFYGTSNDDKIMAETKNETNSSYLSGPKPGGILNIGAGTKPIENAYNIDINPVVEGVYQGNITDLSAIPTGSISKVIMQNPYKYNALDSEIGRVLQSGGIVEITGGMSNRWFNRIFNMTIEQLDALGYELVSRGVASNPEQGYTSSGAAIKSTIMEIILRKK